jgi:hypothetical protein
MENKQTAVDWLLKEINERNGFIFTIYYEELFNQAKAMEKEQIIEARLNGFALSGEGWNGEYPIMKYTEMLRETKCEEYYNETYGK